MLCNTNVKRQRYIKERERVPDATRRDRTALNHLELPIVQANYFRVRSQALILFAFTYLLVMIVATF